MTKSDSSFDDWFSNLQLLVLDQAGADYRDAESVREDYEAGRFRISSHCSFKNDDDRAAAFFAWIAPHLDAAPGDVVGEVEFDGYFGKQLSTLIAQVDRIVEVNVPKEHCHQVDGFF